MKKNKIYHGYHHEDLTLKFLKENTTKYIAKITGAEFCDEINVELINLKPKVLRIDYGIKKKDKIILYEFLSTKSNTGLFESFNKLEVFIGHVLIFINKNIFEIISYSFSFN